MYSSINISHLTEKNHTFGGINRKVENFTFGGINRKSEQYMHETLIVNYTFGGIN